MSKEDQRRETFAKLAAEIDGAGGAMYVYERRLREAHQAGRWSERIAAEVESDYLPRVGLKLWPGQKITRNQDNEVLLYTEKSGLGRIVQWVQHPTKRDLPRLKEAISVEANETLQRVRALICTHD